MNCVYERATHTDVVVSHPESALQVTDDELPPPPSEFEFGNATLSNLIEFDQGPLHGWFDTGSQVVELDQFATISHVLDNAQTSPSPWKTALSKHAANKSAPFQDARFLSRLRASEPLTKQTKGLVMDALCAIPEQMLRRATFPPFIHPHSHRSTLPESLTICTKIAQMFTTRTAETSPFIWRTILSEQRRTISTLDSMSKPELLAAIQAGMVYLIMRVVDGSGTSPSTSPSASPEWNQEMALSQTLLCDRFLSLCSNQFCEDELSNPSLTWEDWIFAESRRRTSAVWFLITRTLVVKTKEGCPTNEAPWMLPLPGPKLVWEARSREDWLEEISAGYSAITNFGELMESKRRCGERIHAERLDSWNARTDNLGSLLNVAVAVV